MAELDIIQAVINQVKGTEYRPNAAFVFIKGEWIDILDKKNRKIVREYFKDKEMNAGMF